MHVSVACICLGLLEPTCLLGLYAQGPGPGPSGRLGLGARRGPGPARVAGTLLSARLRSVLLVGPSLAHQSLGPLARGPGPGPPGWFGLWARGRPDPSRVAGTLLSARFRSVLLVGPSLAHQSPGPSGPGPWPGPPRPARPRGPWGAASDMLRAGSPIGEILVAGSWRSGAFLRYLRRSEGDARAAADGAADGDSAALGAVFQQSEEE